MKKIIIIILILLAGGAGFLAWRFFFQPATPTVVPDVVEKEQTNGAKQKLSAITDKPIFDYWHNDKTKKIYYLSTSGEIYKIGNGQNEKISQQIIEDVHSVNPSPEGNKAIIGFGYPFKTVFTVLDADSVAFQPLPTGTVSAAWDPKSNDRVAYLKNGGRGAVNLLTLTNRKSKELLKLAQQDLELEWVLPNLIYLKEKPSAETFNSVLALDINKLTLKTIVKEEPGLIIKWAPDGNRGLKFNAFGLSNLLSLIDAQNKLLLRLDFITLPSKCTLGNSRGYCAVPRNIPPRTQWPDDYLKRKIYTQDDVYSLNFDTGASEKVFSAADPLDIDRISFRNNELYFINRYDNKLYRLGL